MFCTKKWRMTKIFNNAPSGPVGRVVARLSRKQLSLYIHAITGHNNLIYMNSWMIPEYTFSCRICEEEDDFWPHLPWLPVFLGAKKSRHSIKQRRVETSPNNKTQITLQIEEVEKAMKENITGELNKASKSTGHIRPKMERDISWTEEQISRSWETRASKA